MEQMGRIKPRLTVLNDDQRERIHSESLKILSSVGIRVESEQGLETFAKVVGSKNVTGNLVHIPGEVVENALKLAPSSIEICDRKGAHPIRLLGETHFGIGVTNLSYQDPDTDKPLPFGRKHVETCARLGDMLPSFDFISTPGILHDVPLDALDLYTVLEMTANTTKPLVVLVSEDDALSHVFDLLEDLHGDLASKPFIIPYFNPITPLIMNRGTVDKMFVTIERGLPFVYSNLGMAGASSPITPSGAFTLLNAELLAGLTLAQLIQEGTPVILGCLPAFLDMSGVGGNFYDTVSYLINLSCAEMMSFYDVPHFGTSGSTMGWGADLISAGHQWTNHLLSCLGKAGLVVFIGGVLGSKLFSPNVIVYANDVIGQVRRVAQGFDMDDLDLALDEIAREGPGGHFLTSELTLKHFRHAYFESDIFPLLSFEEWQARGCPKADQMLRDHTKQLIADASGPDDHAELMAKGETFIRKFMAR
jgi:trimethylamine--corrinoid protein Co-methyltransferase